MTIEDLVSQYQFPDEEHKPYWDVFPKLVRVSTTEEIQVIPLSIRGETPSPLVESSNPDVATINGNGDIECGLIPGAAMVLVWKSGAKESLRHVQVEVYGQAIVDLDDEGE